MSNASPNKQSLMMLLAVSSSSFKARRCLWSVIAQYSWKTTGVRSMRVAVERQHYSVCCCCSPMITSTHHRHKILLLRRELHTQNDNDDDEWQGVVKIKKQKMPVPLQLQDNERKSAVDMDDDDDDEMDEFNNAGKMNTPGEDEIDEDETDDDEIDDDEMDDLEEIEDDDDFDDDESTSIHTEKYLEDHEFVNDDEDDHSLDEAELRLDTIVEVRVTRVASTYAVAQAIGYPARGIIPAVEMGRERYNNFPEMSDVIVKEGQVVKALVMDRNEKDNTPIFSLRRVPPLLDESFQPGTIAVFQLPVDMSEEDAMALFSPYGNVLDIQYFHYCRPETPDLRSLTKVTYEHKKEALLAVSKLHRKKIPFPYDPSELNPINVEMSTYQDFVKHYQQLLLHEHNEDMEEWTSTPEMRKMRRMADVASQGIIPYFCEWDFQNNLGRR